MLWRVTLAVAVVCVGSVCNCGQADLMSRLVIPRDYGVKLCGREFIRAVIFTCGGSRWRRSTDSGEFTSVCLQYRNVESLFRRIGGKKSTFFFVLNIF